MPRSCAALSLFILSLAIFSCQKATVSIPPTLTTAPVTGITSNSASSGGGFTSDGTLAITAKGVQWDTRAQFTHPQQSSDGAGATSFTSSLTNLLPNTSYHVRAYATTTDSTYYGNSLTFTTTYTPGKY